MKARNALALAFTCAALVACGGGGGGGGGGGTPNTGGPDLNTVTGLVAYLQQLIAATDETSEPVSLSDGPLPADDTGEPAAI